LFKDNIAAVHLGPEATIKDNSRPLYNTTVGFLMLFKKEKEENSIVNAELYYSFKDMFDYSDSDDKFFERNEIGLRFSIPIQFKTKQ
jgi:hypothetical protein